MFIIRNTIINDQMIKSYVKGKSYILVTTPPVSGERNPMTRITPGMNLPILCFLNLPKAMDAATKWTSMDENKAHRKTWYHISNTINILCQ